MNSINAIPAVVAAAPGLRTHLDLPLVRAPSLFASPLTASGDGSKFGKN